MINYESVLLELNANNTFLTGRFSRFRAREKVSVLTFNHQDQPAQDFVIDDTNPQGADMQRVRDSVAGLRAGGNTAIYSALAEAYRLAAEAQRQEPERYYSVVLMSDGANNSGLRAEQFNDLHGRLPASAKGIRTFTVIFGQANEATMKSIADTTGGQVFDHPSTASDRPLRILLTPRGAYAWGVAQPSVGNEGARCVSHD